MKKLLIVSIVSLLTFGRSTTLPDELAAAEKTKAVKKEREAEIRADQIKKSLGYPAGEEYLEPGKFYHIISSTGVMNEKRELTCFAVLQEVKPNDKGWEATGSNRLFQLNNKTVGKGLIYKSEQVGTNSVALRKVDAIPIAIPGEPSKLKSKTNVL